MATQTDDRVRVAAPQRQISGAQGRAFRLDKLFEPYGIEVCSLGSGPWRPGLGDVLFVNGNLNWYPAVKKQLLKEDPRALPPVVIWHSEPLPPPRASGLPWPWLDYREIAKILLRDPRATDPYTNYFLLRRVHRRGLRWKLFASTLERVEFLQERGIESEHLPLGYYEGQGEDLGLERDIGVLFLGAPTLRRRMKLAYLRRRGVDVLALGDWKDPSLWGEARTRLINRSKIFLNIPRFRGQFALLRFALGASNKALIVSEPLYKPEPFVPGEHYVEASYEQMPEVIRYYLTHEKERREIAENGYRLATGQCNVSRSIEKLALTLRAFAQERRTSEDSHTGLPAHD